MKCQILFSGKNKKNIINLPSAENAQRVVKVNTMYVSKHMCLDVMFLIYKYIVWLICIHYRNMV